MAFVYYNPNPKAKAGKNWHIDDCVIRALCGATDRTWSDMYKIMCEFGAKLYCMPNDIKAITEAMNQFGFSKVSYKRGEPRELAKDIAKKTANGEHVIVVNLAGHIVCCKNGNYMDTWDCGYKTAYNYWIK